MPLCSLLLSQFLTSDTKQFDNNPLTDVDNEDISKIFLEELSSSYLTSNCENHSETSYPSSLPSIATAPNEQRLVDGGLSMLGKFAGRL